LTGADNSLYCCHLQARNIASWYGVEVLVVVGGVLSSAAPRHADEDAYREGCWVTGLDVPSAKPNRRLVILKKAAGVHWQRAMEAGDKRMNDRMRNVSHMLAQLLHIGIKDEVEPSQPGVSSSMPWLSWPALPCPSLAAVQRQHVENFWTGATCSTCIKY
jgi:hypothetical protein